MLRLIEEERVALRPPASPTSDLRPSICDARSARCCLQFISLGSHLISSRWFSLSLSLLLRSPLCVLLLARCSLIDKSSLAPLGVGSRDGRSTEASIVLLSEINLQVGPLTSVENCFGHAARRPLVLLLLLEPTLGSSRQSRSAMESR